MINNQCYDCHSDETKFPWNAYIAPVSWELESNINGARKFFNFSNLGLLKIKNSQNEECYEALEEGEMPVGVYILMHEEAQFSNKESESLKTWFKNFTTSLN